MSIGVAKFLMIVSVLLLLIGAGTALIGDWSTARPAIFIGAMGLFVATLMRRKMEARDG